MSQVGQPVGPTVGRSRGQVNTKPASLASFVLRNTALYRLSPILGAMALKSE